MLRSVLALTLATGASAFVQPALRASSKLATSKVAPAQMMLELPVLQTTNLLAGVVAVGALPLFCPAQIPSPMQPPLMQPPLMQPPLTQPPLTQPPLTPCPR